MRERVAVDEDGNVQNDGADGLLLGGEAAETGDHDADDDEEVHAAHVEDDYVEHLEQGFRSLGRLLSSI